MGPGVDPADNVQRWIDFALDGADVRLRRTVCAELSGRTDRPPADSIAEIEFALGVLERVRRRNLGPSSRTGLRISMMRLVDRLEIELGKRRFIEGNFAAAQFQFSSTHDRSIGVRLSLFALHVAPRLWRAIYLRARRGPSAPHWATSSR